ncbi:hypothetical protein E3P96_00759 [Wallemia ichthyophaga]|uniref:glutamate--tRNA ligase n=1 Tax=Wallemia ichthyophaga TaxID=245174 RepID=A0A4T0JIZ7_WALIC|nr:hypothetical protein E3P96_00759 [Wallemia ichthyophaga]TIB42142.1 hypothetical protein E3P86_00496 [Wallemia ichthyophaga]
MSFELIIPTATKDVPYGAIGIAHYLSTNADPACSPFEYSHVDVHTDFSDDAKAATFKSADGAQVTDLHTILSVLAHAGNISGQSEDKGLVEAYVSDAAAMSKQSFPQLTQSLNKLDDILFLHAFLVGYAPTVADFAIWSSIKCECASSLALGILKKNQHQNVVRFLSFFDTLAQPALQAHAAAKSKKASTKTASGGFSMGLKNAEQGKVVTRFPPEPSGYLHIGHVKAAMLNDYFAKMYNGTLRIRLDDTNPVKEDTEYQDVILEDLKMMGITSKLVTFTSDYFQLLYDKAIELIKLGKAYADDTPAEELKAQRFNRQPSKHRDMPVDEVLKHFEEMSKGTEEGNRWVLRAKINYASDIGTMRDPNIYRVVPHADHHRTGKQWKVYPLYDFCMPIVDSVEGVTHALRSNEYHERNPLYNWIVDTLSMRRAEIWDFGRMNFTYTLLSKRKLGKLVEAGSVKGWDDPRFATVRGILRRGMTVDTLREFILLQGPSQSVVNLQWDQIWSMNKQRIDPVIPRFTACEKKHLVKAVVNGAPSSIEYKELPRHAKNNDLGTKKVAFSNEVYMDQEDAQSFADGEEITMMAWGNAFVKAKEVNSEGMVTGLTLDLHLEGDFKKTKKKVTWLSAKNDFVGVKLMDYDYLINKPRLEESDNLDDFLTPVTEFVTDAVTDSNIKSLNKGDRFQFERKGYFIVDAVKEDGTYELIKIPDGRVASTISKGDEKAQAKQAAQPKRDKREKKEKGKEGNAGKAGKAPSVTDIAPSQAIEYLSLSDKNDGFEIPVKSKMYNVGSVFGDEKVDTNVKTDMYKVDPIYKH